MGYILSTSLPASEPLTVAQMHTYLRLDPGYAGDDDLIATLISAAREHAERITCKALAQRTFRQVMDSMPYYTDTIQSQLAYPPSYYSLPRYSSTLWNYSQMIKLFYPPVISVQRIRFIDSNGEADELHQDADFILDRQSYPARIFPVPGQFWPPNYYTPNSCEIDFTAGYTNNPTQTPDTCAVGLPAYSAAIEYAQGDFVTYSGQTWQANEAVPPNNAPGTSDPSGQQYWSVATTTPAPPLGQQPDSTVPVGIPNTILRILYMLVSFWYDNRQVEAPDSIDAMLAAEACIDFQPTRG